MAAKKAVDRRLKGFMMYIIIRKGITDMIGRIKETEELNRLYNSGKAELVAIYGGRRIGKTYLVDESFKGRITFRHAGLSPVEENKSGMLKAQLEHFLLFTASAWDEKKQKTGKLAGGILYAGNILRRN